MKKIFSCLLLCLMLFSTGVTARASSAFNDVPDGIWYDEGVEWCRQTGIMNGTSDTDFSPEAHMSRAMLATVLYRATGVPGSSNEQHIIEDYDVWDFELSADEMSRMSALDRNARFANF